MFFSPVFASPHPRRSLASFPGLTATSHSPFPLLLPTDHCSLITAHYACKSLPHNSFADPHPLTPVVSILYKNSGEGVSPTFRSQVVTFSPTLRPITPTAQHL